MQCGSTGLGKMALKMRVEDESKMTKLPPTEPPSDSLVLYCKTYDPVIWCVWIGLEPSDLGALLKLAFKWSTIKWVFKSMFSARKAKKQEAALKAESAKETT